VAFSVMRLGAIGAALIFLLLPGTAPGEEEAPPGAIRFEASNLFSTAHGIFHRWHIDRVVVDEESPERSVVEVVVDLASVDTGIERRDAHLRTPDFFDVERYPTARVTLENFRLDERETPARLTADVTLDLHGEKRTFPMEFTVSDRAARLIESEVMLKRTDFGVGGPPRFWNPASVHDEVIVRVEATVPPATTPPPPAP